MSDQETNTNLPAEISEGIAGIPKALVPASIKALDRLIGAAIDIPVAWLEQQKAKIESQTDSQKKVESSISGASSELAAKDHELIKRATDTLVRGSYRKQVNREAVARSMLEDLSNESSMNDSTEQSIQDIDQDWLNVFERYAEDASTERMQNLWGRVLAGEVRKSGRYSMRTLRFLSEFSQADALNFEDFAKFSFGDAAPATLAKPKGQKDIRHLIYLESAGLIQGATGLGLKRTQTFDASGNAFMTERNLTVMMKGDPNSQLTASICALTPLGQELLSLLPSREPRESARTFMQAIRSPAIKAAYLGSISSDDMFYPMEILWQEDLPAVEQ